MSDSFFMGKNGFIWWYGTVEDNGDPLALGRCRIRIAGWHNQNIEELPTETLPWAYPITPITNSAVAGIGVSPIGPQPGTRVIGFFNDGETGQQPMFFGTLPGKSVQESGHKTPYGSTPAQPNKQKWFNKVFSREGDCPDGYAVETTAANNTVPDQSRLPISKGEWVLPFTGFVSSAYNDARGNGTHKGVDICPAGYYKQQSAGAAHLNGKLRGATGLPVFAAADGEVVYIWTADKGQKGVATQYDKTGRGSRSYGNAVAIRHTLASGTYTTIYAHLGSKQDAGSDAPGAGINVSVGQRVTKGQQIGTVGRSHVWDSLTHLHFEIRVGTGLPASNNHINPGRIFPQLNCVHTSQLGDVLKETNYNLTKLPFKLSDAPVISRQGPKE